jgi:hypothetical protein
MDTTIDFILQTPLLSNNHTRYFGSAVIVEFPHFGLLCDRLPFCAMTSTWISFRPHLSFFVPFNFIDGTVRRRTVPSCHDASRLRHPSQSYGVG